MVPAGSLSTLSPLAPFLGKRVTMWGRRGFQRGPKDQRCSSPGSPCLAITWAPEKYWRLWLTELFFRFEPAPLLTQIRQGKGKRFPGPASPWGRGRSALRERRPLLSCRPQSARPWGVECVAGASPGLGVRPSARHPRWRLRTGRDLVHKACASGIKIEQEKCLERICYFQMSVVDGKSQSCGTSLH